MANPKHKLEREDLMAFLLGELEDAEQSRIEAMFLDDVSLRDDLETAKSQLFQEYNSGRLSERLSGVFEKRFLPAGIEEDRKEFRAMLAKNEKERSLEAEAEVTEPASEAPPSPAAIVSKTAAAPLPEPAPKAEAPPARQTKTKRSRTLPIVLVALLVVGAGAAVALVKGFDSPGSDKGEVTLRSFSVRGQSQLVALPPGKELFLVLPHRDVLASATYRVQLLFGAQREELAAKAVDGEVRVAVVREDLQEGRYDVELSAMDASGVAKVLGYYSFRK